MMAQRSSPNLKYPNHDGVPLNDRITSSNNNNNNKSEQHTDRDMRGMPSPTPLHEQRERPSSSPCSSSSSVVCRRGGGDKNEDQEEEEEGKGVDADAEDYRGERHPIVPVNRVERDISPEGCSSSSSSSHTLHVNRDTGQLEVSIGHIRYGVIPGSAAERDLLQGQPYLSAPSSSASPIPERGPVNPVAPPTTSTSQKVTPAEPVTVKDPDHNDHKDGDCDRRVQRGLANRIIEQRLGLHSQFGGRVRLATPSSSSSSDSRRQLDGHPALGHRFESPSSSSSVMIHSLAREMSVFKKPQVPARFQVSPEDELRRIVRNMEAVFEVESDTNAPDPNQEESSEGVKRRKVTASKETFPETMSRNEDVRGFHCRLCPSFSPDQRAFYFHLKTHYEADHADDWMVNTEPSDDEPFHERPDPPEDTGYTARDIAENSVFSQGRQENAEKNPNNEFRDVGESSLFQCHECSKNFRTKGALRVHARIHKDERPFPCDGCTKSFRQISDLNYHRQSLHSRHKSFVCEFCPKSFSRKYSLTLHRRIHTQERNHVCEVCQKAFRAAIYLTVHKRSHTGEKPYECDVCSKAFRTRSDMTRHLSRVHQDQKHHTLGHAQPTEQRRPTHERSKRLIAI